MTKHERAELKGYLSAWAVVGRAALFFVALAIVALPSRSVQLLLGLPDPLWLLPATGAGAFLFVRSRRWTGGRELRNRIRLDLLQNQARVCVVRVREAILFQEREDEGPTIFVLDEGGETILFAGQEFARHADRGFPWKTFEIRECPRSRRFLGIRRRGDKFEGCGIRPPLPAEQFGSLGFDSVAAWRIVDIPFEQVRQASQ